MLGAPAMARVKTCGVRLLLCFIQSISIFVETLDGTAQAKSHEGLVAYVHGDYVLAARLFRPLADAGDVDSQFLLGVISEQGLARDPDDHAAAVWYLLAAQGGDPVAQLSIGLMYAEGRGLKWDFLEAYVWLSRAMVDLPAGAGREEAAEARRSVRAVLRPEELLRAEERLLRVLGYGAR